MSFILDALRKSEQERRQAEPLVLASAPATEPINLPQRSIVPLIVGAAIVSIVCVAFALWILFVKPSASPSIPVAVSAPSTPVATAPTVSNDLRMKVDTPPPELKPYPLAQTPDNSGVRDLAAEAQVESHKATPRSTSAPSSKPPTVASTNVVAVPTAPETSVKFLRSMPLDFQRSLPELIVNIHIYAPREADRILYINNRQYHAGDRVRDDVMVEEIVEDGAVLSAHGQRFKLPRPS